MLNFTVGSEGIPDKMTTLTLGRDEAFGIYQIALGKPLADAVHITTMENMTWMEILKMYASIIKEQTGKNIILYTSHEIELDEMLYERVLIQLESRGNELFLPLNSDYEKEMDRLLYDSFLQKKIVRL